MRAGTILASGQDITNNQGVPHAFQSQRDCGCTNRKALTAYSQIDNIRVRELVKGLIRHLHAFIKEVKLTDEEFETAWTLMAEMSKFTGDERNDCSAT